MYKYQTQQFIELISVQPTKKTLYAAVVHLLQISNFVGYDGCRRGLAKWTRIESMYFLLNIGDIPACELLVKSGGYCISNISIGKYLFHLPTIKFLRNMLVFRGVCENVVGFQGKKSKSNTLVSPHQTT